MSVPGSARQRDADPGGPTLSNADRIGVTGSS
ncbi:hypothetical protein HEB94_003799 [Actinopolymorpha pittospori]|uniref:Uncharacterized protein n=1 Tax=Actinopolymorpha pittospori TaxID=648752 RepID=A0A927MU56_9ACTN|nr:hypothetical protein [Actinopolymorpha pittospori]